MMAADSLHVAYLLVPSGVSIPWLSACRRACSASASAPHFALSPAQPATCRRLASNAPGLRPSPRSPARWLTQQHRRAAGAWSDSGKAKAKSKTKDAALGRVESRRQGWRGTGGFAAVPRGARRSRQCRHVRVLRTTGHARACRMRGHERPPRRRFPGTPSAPKNRGKGQGQSFVSKVLKQAGKASSGKQVLDAPFRSRRQRRAPVSAPFTAGAATRRRASPGRS